MATDITKAIVERLIRETAEGGRRELIDRTAGLILRVGRRGATWTWKYEKNHQTLRLTIGPWPSWSITDAREVAANATAMVRARRGIPNEQWLQTERIRLGQADAGAAEATTPETFGAWDFSTAREKYLEVLKATRAEATWRDRKRMLNSGEFKPFERRRVATITRREFAEMIAGVHARGAERHAAHYAETIRPMWTFLASDAVAGKSGVAEGVMERLKAPERTRRSTHRGKPVLSRGQYVPPVEELARIAAIAEAGVLSEGISVALTLLVYSGQRRRMVASAVAQDFKDLGEAGALWHVPAAHRKSAIRRGVFSDHVVPIPPSLWARIKPQVARAIALQDQGEEDDASWTPAAPDARAKHKRVAPAPGPDNEKRDWLFPGSRPRKIGEEFSHMHPDNLTHRLRELPGVLASAHELRNGFATHVEATLGYRRSDTKLILDHTEGGQSNDVTSLYALHQGVHEKWPIMKDWVGLLDAALPAAKRALPARRKLAAMITAARKGEETPVPARRKTSRKPAG